MEFGTPVAKAVLARGKLSEVPCSNGDMLIIKLEYDSTFRLVINGDIKLRVKTLTREGKIRSQKGLTYTLDILDSYDQEVVDGSTEGAGAFKQPRLLPNRRDNLVLSNQIRLRT